MSAAAWRVGVDVGGTFTDLVALHRDGRLVRCKVPSTPRAPDEALLGALRAVASEVPPPAVALLAHASTIATNALLGQLNLELPRVAFVTTEGFRDVLEIGRQNRSTLYDLAVTRPKPLARREDRLTVRERRAHDGSVITPLDQASLAAVVATLRERAIASVAIGFLHADVDGSHERLAADAIARALPGISLSLSHEVDPQYREYERFSTTVVDAALAPIVRAYLERVAAGLRADGVTAPMYVMRSDGGMATLERAARTPASLIESGPAAGAIAAAFAGRALGIANVLSFDMGGTTAKAGTIRDGTPQLGNAFEAAGATHSGRGVRGSGYPVRFPFVDLAEISAGGGTIARLDAAGVLRVGPLSAGADPGPACYGRGAQPTVTDANVVLGRLDPRALLGGAFPIDAARAQAAVATVSAPLGGDVRRTAAGIVALVDAEMAKALRIVSVERGLDPRDFTLLAFGGGGPLHACAIAEEAGIARIVIPPLPGVFSAYGLLAADVRASAVRSFVAPANAATWERAGVLLDALHADVDASLAAQGVAPSDRTFVRELDLRYLGQSTELTVVAGDALADALAAFERAHERRYGYAVPGEAVEFATARVAGIGTTPKPPLVAARDVVRRTPGPRAIRTQREVYDGAAFAPAPVYDRGELVSGDAFAGPAIVEQYDATVFAGRAWSVAVDAFGNLVLERS